MSSAREEPGLYTGEVRTIMTAVSQLWAEVPTGNAAPLPAMLSPVVRLRGPDPLRSLLLPGADAAQAEAFGRWRAVHGETFHLADEATAKVAAAWLSRSGAEVSFDRERSWDAAALSALWWRCEGELDDVPALAAFTARLGEVAQRCRMRGTHAVLRLSATSYPIAS